MANVGVVAGLFFPHCQALGIDPDDTASPVVLRKMVYAGVHARSFKEASRHIEELAELKISDQRIARATKHIGRERVAQREAEAEAYEELSLPTQQQSPCEQVPQVACVLADGGRLQIRDRQSSDEEEQPTEQKEQQPTEREEDREERPTEKSSFWREFKGGVLQSMASKVSQDDPCPEIPHVFIDRERMRKISREIKGYCVPDKKDKKEDAEESSHDESPTSQRPGQPEVLVRSVVATREDVHIFGKLLAAAAWRRGFAAATRKAFVADGQEANWTVWRRHFSHYTPILDFIHAICYVFAAAVAGRPLSQAWPIYCEWAQWVWSGRVDLVIAALRIRQQELGLPEKDESEETPRSKVATALRYLENQQSRMRYDEYRRLGLPITSSHMESTIKQINRRLKGTEKFWSEGGAEALLQLSADYLSETNSLTTFWRDRPTHATGQRCYQSSS